MKPLHALKSVAVCLIAVWSLGLLGCGATQEAGVSPREFLEAVVMDEQVSYQPEIWEDARIKRPNAIAIHDDLLYITDDSENKVFVLGSDGQYRREFGQVGNMPGQLLAPSAMYVDDDEVIVAEDGNRRLQAFDHEGNSKYTVPIDLGADPIAQISGIAKSESGFLVCAMDRSVKNGDTILELRRGRTQRGLAKKRHGSLINAPDGVFFLESMTFFDEGREFGYTSGKNAVWLWESEKLKRVANLPDSYTLCGIALEGGQFLTLSGAFGNIDVFDKDFKYVGTRYCVKDEVTKPFEDLPTNGLAVNSKGDLFVALRAQGKILKLKRAN